MTGLRLGVDVGGTFTDHILFDEDSGLLYTFKTPSTPEDPSRSVMAGVGHFATAPRGLSGLWLMAHGTTVNTNTVLSRTGAKIGLITTKGFRDVLAIGRQTRPHFYRWDVDRPAPLAPRHLRLEVSERIDSRGRVVLPLCEEDVRRCAEVLEAHGVEAVAVCLLNSYANADHEARVKEILEEALPNVYLAVSYELSPEFREFERSSTVATVAYIGPGFQRYVDELQRSLARELAPPPKLYIMQSSGGMASAEVEMRRPHFTLESGPAAGVLAAVDLGLRLDMPDIISFDMGGTTAKASLIQDGKPSIVSMLEIGKEATGFYGIRITGLARQNPLNRPGGVQRRRRQRGPGGRGGTLEGGARQRRSADPGPCLLRRRRHGAYGHRCQRGLGANQPGFLPGRSDEDPAGVVSTCHRGENRRADGECLPLKRPKAS